MKEMKSGRAGLDICATECLKSGGAMVIDGLVILLNVCFVSSIVPIDSLSESVIALYEGKRG